MTPDLTAFKVLLMTGKSFTPSQQAWPALTLECFAQLGGKRAQKKLIGLMRSLCWTDHANVTKQQSAELADVDLKVLRWIAEICGDGSEIKSLAGRAARLGDGTSRNPPDREALLEQRSKDLKGVSGQVRAFDVDEFLSSYELPGAAVPWGIGDDAWVKERPEGEVKEKPQPQAKSSGKTPAYFGAAADVATFRALMEKRQGRVATETVPVLEDELLEILEDEAEASLDLPRMMMTSGGVAPNLKVLFVPD